ncbi:MAG: DUF2240 family protein [Candidatus Aenigmarchaeota archaeon]|nr:DUF2240 family protein [Candidatus Aenigmarchaeota archaeon]
MKNLNEIIDKIAERTGKDRNEILEMVKQKHRDMSNLISEEGAAYIVAKDMGIELIKKREYDLKVCNVISGMQNINIVGRITRIDDVKNFKTKRKDDTGAEYDFEGRVCSLHIGDDTGVIRLVLWNDEIDSIKGLNRGDVIRISNGYVKDNFGIPEIRLGGGKIEKIEKEMPTIEEIERSAKKPEVQKRFYSKMNIADIKQGDSASIRACLVQIFQTSMFFFTCPECGIRVKDKCEVHGKGEPNLVISGVADDGTGNIRIVLFRNSAEKVLGLSTGEAWKLFKESDADALRGRIQLGKDFIFNGFVKRNQMFDRLEFVANEVEDVDIKEEVERLLK